MPNSPIDIPALLAKLKVEEKVSLLSGRDEWSLNTVARLGTPSAWFSDGPHGLRRAPFSTVGGYGDQLPATCFPTASAIAATWDVELVEELGRKLGEECLALGVDVILGPGANIKRSPLGGRNFEYFSEDPRLAGEIAAAYIRGVQAEGAGTSLKHFCCNSQETRRMMVDSRPGARALREIYLAAFEIAVKEGRPWTVMASYNPVDGVDMTANEALLSGVLRGEWGYEGLVVSDWQAVYDRVAGVAAGLDLEMPGSRGFHDAQVVAAAKTGRLSAEKLDAAAGRVLALGHRAAASRAEHGAADPLQPRAFDAEGHHAFARRVAAEASVLLKNEGAVLPLDFGKLGRVALIGEFAEKPRCQGNGSSEVKPTRVDVLREELGKLAGKAEIVYAPGYSLADDGDFSRIEAAVALAASCDAAVVVAGLPNQYESEGIDRTHISLPPAMDELVARVAQAQPRTAVALVNGSAVVMPWIDAVPAVIECWLGGQAGAGGMADVLAGRVNPSGKLAETFPARIEDTPSFLDLPSADLALEYSEGVFAGYRWYDKRRIEPLFCFGHGLSYASFEYSDLKLSAAKLRGKDGLRASLRVRNAGNVAGKEVVQLYLRDPASSLPRPERELKRFKKIALNPGESGEVAFEIGERDLSFWDDALGRWVAESGSFEVLVGSSSRDIRLRASFEYESGAAALRPFSERTCLRDWIRHPETRVGVIALVKPFFDANPVHFVGAYDDFNVSNGFFLDMPLIKYSRLTYGAISEEAIRDFVERMRRTPVAL